MKIDDDGLFLIFCKLSAVIFNERRDLEKTVMIKLQGRCLMNRVKQIKYKQFYRYDRLAIPADVFYANHFTAMSVTFSRNEIVTKV